MNGHISYAPVKKRVVLPVLAAIALLAAAVCMLHWENAVSLRGTAAVGDDARTDSTAENLVPILDDPWAEDGVLHISGALVRPDQTVGTVNVRVGLIPQTPYAGAPAGKQDEAILLNTQMVRRADLAQAYGADDHCGFHAAVQLKRLDGNEIQYRVVLADETEGAGRMIETGMTVTPMEGGLAFTRAAAPESEAQDAQ